MKVRIVKASKPTYWYADKIGTAFTVQRDVQPFCGYVTYYKEVGGTHRGFIEKTDCEVVK